jgi:hypothetical protein
MTPRAIKALVSKATREQLASGGSLFKTMQPLPSNMLAGGGTAAATTDASPILTLTIGDITVRSDIFMRAPASLNFRTPKLTSRVDGRHVVWARHDFGTAPEPGR